MPVSYKLFTVLLHAMGIYPVTNRKLRFHLKTWIPNIFWLVILILKIYIDLNENAFADNAHDTRNTTANVLNVNYIQSSTTTDSTPEDTAAGVKANARLNEDESHQVQEEDGASLKLLTVILFFGIKDYVYRAIILIIVFRSRFVISAFKLELRDSENNLTHPSRMKRRMMKSGIWFLVLNVLVFLSFCGIDLYDTMQAFNSVTRFAISLTVDFLSSAIETIGTFAVEGLLIYYSWFFKFVIKEYNEDLKGHFDALHQEENSDSKRNLEGLQELRLRLVEVNSMFQKAVSIMSVMLAISVFDCLLTACFAIFYIDKAFTVTNELQDVEELNRVVLKMFISTLKLIIICVGEYPHNEASKTYRLLSGVKLPNSADNDIKEEMILLHLTKNSVSFRFTLGGFCDLKKSLLPTIAGAIITYTVILCQD